MKSYVANGTGSQQTLTESQDNKIPVYDSVSDAESDLANLAENQIIATHDTGSELSAPVDTVQSGNMHAVTSNAVAESLSYSTEEMATGGKWIDGKPIYRKVFTVTNTSSAEITMGTITSYNWIVNVRVIGKIATNDDIITDGYGNNNLGVVVKGNGNIIVYNQYDMAKVIAIVEYTKPNN